MKYYIIAGEASGDMHAANLVKSLRQIDSDATIRGWGGDLMEKAGVQLVKHYRDTAFMGYWNVAKNLNKILSNLRLCQNDIQSWNPDVVILVDYPGFNLKIAEFAKKHGYKVVYYIPPKLWAWKKHRIKTIRKSVDLILSILPFEEAFYRELGITVQYVGNPTVDNIETTLNRNELSSEFITKNSLSGKPIIALLPGSRMQEIRQLLPVMVSVQQFYSEYEFVIAGAPGIAPQFYHGILKGIKLPIIFNDTYQLVFHSHAALVASGTATLETALIGTPQVVCYKMGGGFFTYWFGKLVLRSIKYISLVNLILNKLAVVELLQHQVNTKALSYELGRICKGETRVKMIEDYRNLQQILGSSGASTKAAQIIVNFVNDSQ
ncbi:MAG TPA: lipid-A-disaccharide synthase [Salinivirgaceae bacterium]|nr:lipid-A-disaccharide synthase [Salinivirgaceae bacterium]